MKKYLLSTIMGSFLLLLFGFQQTMAQDSKSSKVHITITEDNQVTSDTTFELAEGQDPEMIKKMVSHMAGGDFHTKHMSQDVWVSSDDHGDIDSKHMHMMMDINMDSIKEAHPDAKILVIKNKDGEITVKEVDDEHEMHFGDEDDDCEGKEKKIKVIVHSSEDMEWVEKGDGDENVEVYVIKNGDDVKVIKRKVTVEVEDGDPVEVEVDIEEEKEGKKKKK